MEFKELVGQTLLGFMPLNKEQYTNGDWDNAIALYLGKKESPRCVVLRTQNQDYSCFDHWLLEEAEHIERTSTYKAIGEIIEAAEDRKEQVKVWTLEEDQYWLEIRTASKVLRMGHHWNDCHYPNSIWEESGRG